MRRELVADWEKLFTVNQPFEEENVRLGRLFNTLMVISSGVALSIAIALLLMIPLGHVAPHLALIATAFPILFVPVSVLCVILSRRGHTKFSIKLYVWLNCIAICLAAYLFDGVNSPAWYIFLWTITISGTLLTPGHSLGMAGGVLAYFILLGSLTSFGVYTPPLTFGNQQREELDVIFLLLMLVSTGGLLTYLNMRSLRKSFEFLHTEIIEHRQAEEESRRLKDEWERTFHAVPDLITILDQDYKILRTNASLDKRLDLPPNTCIGQKCYSLIDGLEAPHDNCPHAQLLRDGQQHSAEISIDRLEGTFEITDTPLYDESGKLVGSVHIARDITSRKQAEADLRARRVLRVVAVAAPVQSVYAVKGANTVLAGTSKGVAVVDTAAGKVAKWVPIEYVGGFAELQANEVAAIDTCYWRLHVLSAPGFEVKRTEQAPVRSRAIARDAAGLWAGDWQNHSIVRIPLPSGQAQRVAGVEFPLSIAVIAETAR